MGIGPRGAGDTCGVVMRLWKGSAYCWLHLQLTRVVRGYVCVWQKGWTPFRIAQRKGHADVAAVLAEAGGR